MVEYLVQLRARRNGLDLVAAQTNRKLVGVEELAKDSIAFLLLQEVDLLHRVGIQKHLGNLVGSPDGPRIVDDKGRLSFTSNCLLGETLEKQLCSSGEKHSFTYTHVIGIV